MKKKLHKSSKNLIKSLDSLQKSYEALARTQKELEDEASYDYWLTQVLEELAV